MAAMATASSVNAPRAGVAVGDDFDDWLVVAEGPRKGALVAVVVVIGAPFSRIV